MGLTLNYMKWHHFIITKLTLKEIYNIHIIMIIKSKSKGKRLVNSYPFFLVANSCVVPQNHIGGYISKNGFKLT